jgi:hypothetical protein
VSDDDEFVTFGVIQPTAVQCDVPAVDFTDVQQPAAGSLAASAGSALLRLRNNSCSMAPPEQLVDGQQEVVGPELCYVRRGGMLKAADMLRLPPV